MQDEREQERHGHHHDAVRAQLQREHHEARAKRTADERQPQVLKMRAPDRERAFALVQPDCHGNRKRVQKEVERREDKQPRTYELDGNRSPVQRLKPDAWKNTLDEIHMATGGAEH